MEHWPTCEHGKLCALKTGTRPGPSHGKNFYICRSRPNQQCRFVQPVEVDPMMCPQHTDMMVTVRTIADPLEHTVHYRCMKGAMWCGVTQWREEREEGGKENVNPYPTPQKTLAKSHDQSSFKLDLSSEEDSCMEESITEEPAGGLSSHSSEAEGQSDQSVFIKEEEGQGDQEEEVEWQGNQEEEVEGQGNQEEEVEGQGNQEEEVEGQGNQEEEVEGQGDQEEEVEGKGNQEEEVEGQGNQEEEVEGQGNQEEEVEGQGNQEEEVEGQGNQEEEVEGQGNQEEEVEGQGDQEEKEEGQGNQEEEGESVVSISSGEEETEANVVYVTDTTAEESVLEPDSAEPSLSGSPSLGQELSPGGAAASEQREEEEEEETDSVRPKTPEFKLGSQYRTLYRQLQQTETLLHTMAERLPDGGQRLRVQRQEILDKISHIKKSPPPDLTSSASTASAGSKLFQKGINQQTRMLTTGVVEQLHSSLESCPGVDTLAPQPDQLSASLFPHQRRALAWLLWREKQLPSGGMLADEMGLGKTLSMISLILENPSDHSHHKDGLVTTGATLVVCAPSLIHQWEAEVVSKVQLHTLSVLIYHGSRRTKYPQDLAGYDVVITTYDIVGSEGASALSNGEETSGRRRRVASCTTLFQVYWHRIILDEAHKIRNPKTAMAIGVTGLKKVHRWAVTGTPVQNKLMDLYSLIRFLELAPFDDIREWKRCIEKQSVVGMQRLRTMIAVLVLRRTKLDVASTHRLPEKHLVMHKVELSVEEQNVYDALFSEARKVFVRFLAEQKQGDHVHGSESTSPTVPSTASPPPVPLPPAVQRCLDDILHSVKGGQVRQGAVLVLLLRLRQCCCHPGLMVTGVQGTDVEEGLEEALDGLSLSDDLRPKVQCDLPPVFRGQRLSTKSCEVLREVRRIRGLDPPEKCIIVSQWKKLLDIIQYQLDAAGISHTSINGSVPPKQRNINMSQFNSPSKDPSVMLLSMVAGGEGLNLVGGNHVFLLDLHWNPAVELQATDRAHRMGQTRDVHVHRFVCQSTVEERILVLQQKKLDLSAAVLSGASRPKHESRLTLKDLKDLFQV